MVKKWINYIAVMEALGISRTPLLKVEDTSTGQSALLKYAEALKWVENYKINNEDSDGKQD